MSRALTLAEGVLHSDASWWPAHVSLPHILLENIGKPLAGVEVGVAFGSMTIALCRAFGDLKMLAVDPFITYDPDDAMSDLMEREGDDLEELVRWRFALEQRAVDRIDLQRVTSLAAAATVEPRSMDFVFLDADHRYEAVRDDIIAWTPALRSGGLLCGHDFSPQWPGVERAVRELIVATGHDVHVHPSTIWFSVIP